MDPFLYAGDVGELECLRRTLVDGARRRRSCWRNREEAKEHLRRQPRRPWDEQVLDLYVVGILHLFAVKIN